MRILIIEDTQRGLKKGDINILANKWALTIIRTQRTLSGPSWVGEV
jgi:hypothetical protein